MKSIAEQRASDVLLVIEKAGVLHSRSCPHGSGIEIVNGVSTKVYGRSSSLTDEDSFDVCDCDAREVYEAAQRLLKEFK